MIFKNDFEKEKINWTLFEKRKKEMIYEMILKRNKRIGLCK